jgi:hypothetical protein
MREKLIDALELTPYRTQKIRFQDIAHAGKFSVAEAKAMFYALDKIIQEILQEEYSLVLE